jgi:ABC-type glycerol-3-phosphate transport system substrate-binding protein
VYDKDLFDAAGIAYPSATVPMTVAEYADIARQLTREDGDIAKKVWGGTASVPYTWMDPTTMMSPDAHQVVGYLDDEPTIAAWDQLAAMAREGTGITASELDAVGGDASVALLAEGRLGMSFLDNDKVGELQALGANVGVAPFPVEQAGDAPWVPSWTDGWAIFSGSQHQEEAKELLRYVADVGGQLRLDLGAVPLDLELASQYGNGDPAREQLVGVMAMSRPGPFLPGFWSVFPALEDTFSQVIDTGDAATALQDIAPLLEDDLTLQWETWDAIQ